MAKFICFWFIFFERLDPNALNNGPKVIFKLNSLNNYPLLILKVVSEDVGKRKRTISNKNKEKTKRSRDQVEETKVTHSLLRLHPKKNVNPVKTEWNLYLPQAN